MTASIPTKEPEFFIAGDTVKWTKELLDYKPADGWVLSYALVQAGSQKTITASDNGDGSHLATISAADSANYTAGTYYWQAYVTKSTERYLVCEGRVEVKQNFASMSNGHDGRSHIKKVIDALEAMIEGKASKDQKEYKIGDRLLIRMDPAELLKWLNHYKILYKQELQKENIENGGSGFSHGQVRF